MRTGIHFVEFQCVIGSKRLQDEGIMRTPGMGGIQIGVARAAPEVDPPRPGWYPGQLQRDEIHKQNGLRVQELPIHKLWQTNVIGMASSSFQSRGVNCAGMQHRTQKAAQMAEVTDEDQAAAEARPKLAMLLDCDRGILTLFEEGHRTGIVKFDPQEVLELGLCWATQLGVGGGPT